MASSCERRYVYQGTCRQSYVSVTAYVNTVCTITFQQVQSLNFVYNNHLNFELNLNSPVDIDHRTPVCGLYDLF